MRNLGVFIDNVLVGTLHDTDPLSFTYTQDCLSGLVSATLSFREHNGRSCGVATRLRQHAKHGRDVVLGLQQRSLVAFRQQVLEE